MPRTKIQYDDYKVKAFLDANIILECRPISELPWHEIDANGPIIALMTPTAIKEVDSKKQDGRIGKRAREFNRLISSVAAGGPPIIIRESGPHVELALAHAVRIPWDQHDDLDPDDGDACIVAEMLHAKDMDNAGKLLVSHDIKPISYAANYDLETFHISDEWLRQAEPSPADKEVQKLKIKLAEYMATEPEFKIKIEMPDGELVSVTSIEDLTDVERNSIERKIFAKNPKQDQLRGNRPFDNADFFETYDDSYNENYEVYRRQVPIFMATYEQRLERLFNQARFTLTISNIGKVQAENLLVDVYVSSGWLHDRYVFASPVGPDVPKPRRQNIYDLSKLSKIPSIIPPITPHVGRHEVVFKDRPNWDSYFSVTCEDFRHGQDWKFSGIVGFDPHSPETKIIVSVTASNLRGKAQEIKLLGEKKEAFHISQLINLETLKVVVNTPIDEVIRRQAYDEIDPEAFANYDVDEDAEWEHD